MINIPKDLSDIEVGIYKSGYSYCESLVKVKHNDIQKKYGKIDVVIGGPPCQGFSNANRQKNHAISQNNMLVKQYVRFTILDKNKYYNAEPAQYILSIGFRPEDTTSEQMLNCIRNLIDIGIIAKDDASS